MHEKDEISELGENIMFGIRDFFLLHVLLHVLTSNENAMCELCLPCHWLIMANVWLKHFGRMLCENKIDGECWKQRNEC
jgi:hypothetical protein